MAKDKNQRRKEVRAKHLAAEKRRVLMERETERGRRADTAKTLQSAVGMRLLDAPFGKVIAAGDPDKMNSINIGTIRLYRPRIDIEVAERKLAEDAFRAKYPPGAHTDANVINPILQSQFSYFDHKLKQIIPQIASRHMIEFVLQMYGDVKLSHLIAVMMACLQAGRTH